MTATARPPQHWPARTAARILALLAAVLAASPSVAEEVRLTYDSRGNITAIEDASLAAALQVQRFAPGYGRPGDSITVVGRGFSTTLSSNQVTVGGAVATVTAAAADHLKITIPAAAVSGPVGVTVGGNTAQSTSSFIVLPSGTTSADVVSKYDLVADGAAVKANTLPGRNAVLAFQASPGDLLSFQFSQLLPSNESAQYKVYAPNGTQIATGTLHAADRSIHLPIIASAGPHALIFKATSSLRTRVALETAAPVTIDGTATTTGTQFAGQSRRLRFTGSVGQNLGAGISDQSFVPSGAYALSPTFYRPNGAALASLSNIPDAGTYSVIVKGSSGTTQSTFKFWLSTDVSGSLTINVPATMAATRPGQNARYTFAGTTGQRLRLATALATTSPPNQRVAISIYKPDGACLAPSTCYATATTHSPYVNEMPELPSTGTYVVVAEMNPYDDQNATFSVPVVVAEEVAIALTIDAAAADAATTVRGQYIRATFSGTTGQNLGLGYTDAALSPSGAYVMSVTYYAPNGSVISSLNNLPQTGTYSALFKLSPETTQSSMKLWLSSEVTGSLSVNTPATIAVTRPAQTARYTFSGTSGQRLRLASGLTTMSPGTFSVAFYVYKPDGTCLVSGCYVIGTSSSPYVHDLPSLPTTGTYTVLVDMNPYENQNGYFSVPIVLAEEVTTALTADAPSTAVSTTVRGQYVRASFSGSTGQNLRLGHTNAAYTPSGAYLQTVSYFAPDGNPVASLSNLPQNGTYAALYKFSADMTQASLTLWLSSDVTGSLPEGSTVTVSVTRPSQQARYSFSGSSGQLLRMTTAAASTTPASRGVSVYIYKPDGTCLVSGCYVDANATTGFTDLPALPTAGTYTFLFAINPYSDQNASFSSDITLTNR